MSVQSEMQPFVQQVKPMYCFGKNSGKEQIFKQKGQKD